MLSGGLAMSFNHNRDFLNAPKVRLGDYIKRSTVNNKDERYGIELIEGVTNEGVFSQPKGNPMNVDLKPYKIVNNGAFVYNPSRLDLGSIAYRTDGLCIVSHLYIVFYLNDEGKKKIDPDWLFMYFRRDEFYREVTFRNFGSQRPEFNFNDMSDIMIPLPDISVQRKYVAIYKTMVANQQSYERGLEDLKIVFTGYIENLRKTEVLHRIGAYITPYNEKNIDESITLEQGINIEKRFITPQRSNSNLQGRKIVRHGQFAYCTQLNNENVAIAYRDGCDCVVSSVYDVFEITKKDELIPEYLLMWLIRSEFGRFVYWASEGSAYEFLNYNNLANYMIPVPDIKVQKSIADIYNAYITRKQIGEQLKAQIKDICPILIRGSLEK
jgi:type I restriction enzyme S subunit